MVLLLQQYTAQVKSTDLENERCGMKRKFTSPKFVTLRLDIGISFSGRLVILFLFNGREYLKHEVKKTESVLVQHF